VNTAMRSREGTRYTFWPPVPRQHDGVHLALRVRAALLLEGRDASVGAAQERDPVSARVRDGVLARRAELVLSVPEDGEQALAARDDEERADFPVPVLPPRARPGPTAEVVLPERPWRPQPWSS
jgi:hypothetical protein